MHFLSIIAFLASLHALSTLAGDNSPFFLPLPEAFANTNVVLLKDQLAVIPGEWEYQSAVSSLHNIRASDPSVVSALSKVADASFVAWDERFLAVIGPEAKIETIQTFESPEDKHVHEAPVYVAESNELVYSDTSQVGWLWAVEMDTHESKTRKIQTDPPLNNVNGATYHDGLLYACTNGGSVRGIFSINVTTGWTKPILNNYRGRHFNSPNDLIFDSNNNIYFTDPTYGWAQQWPGVQQPELPNAIYHFDTRSKAVTALSNSPVHYPNGLALSLDERTLYVADSNSSFGSPTSVRNVWAFDVEHSSTILRNPRLVYQAESGWPDGLRVSRNGLLFIAVAGGADVVDPQTGLLLGKIATPGDIILNLEPANGERDGVWLLTGNKAVYKVTLAEGGNNRRSLGEWKGNVGAIAEQHLGRLLCLVQNLYQRAMTRSGLHCLSTP